MTEQEYATLEAAYSQLNKAIDRVKRQTRDTIDLPEEDPRERRDYLINQVLDSAHEILDLAHDFKHALHLTFTR